MDEDDPSLKRKQLAAIEVSATDRIQIDRSLGLLTIVFMVLCDGRSCERRGATPQRGTPIRAVQMLF